MIIERRSIIKGLVALVAAPAIVKVGSLMPVNAALQPGISLRKLEDYTCGEPVARLDVLYGTLKCGDTVTWAADVDGPLREFVIVADGSGTLPKGTRQGLTMPSNLFLEDFGAQDAKIGDELRIRLPNDFMVTDYNRDTGLWSFAPKPVEPVQIPAPLALAVAAIAIAPQVLKTPVTRRFWSRS